MTIIIRSYRMTLDDVRLEATRGDHLRLKPGEKCHGIYDPSHPFHEPCTGVHSHSRPRAEWCPRTRALDRYWDDSWERSLYKYRWFLKQSMAGAIERSNQLSAEWREWSGLEPIVTRATRTLDSWDSGSGASKPQQDRMRELLHKWERGLITHHARPSRPCPEMLPAF